LAGAQAFAAGHLFMQNQGRKPCDSYLNLGFESLSLFSLAFKKDFGLAPTALLTHR
jgi:AraC family transcriptional regulator, exoenzyme S synthesis regulatory protein ExsA